MTPLEQENEPANLAAKAMLFLRRTFGAVGAATAPRKERYARGPWKDLRDGIAMDHAAAVAGVIAGGATLEDFFGYDGTQPDKQPLYAALRQRQLKVAAAIADAKPEWVTETDANGETLLHRLAAGNSSEAVSFLIARDADMEIRNNKGQTPVMLAINAGSFDAAVALANAGAKIDLADPVVEKALRVATVEMHVDFLKTIGRRQAEAKDIEQANIDSEIGAIRNGTTHKLAVRTLRLLPRTTGAP